MRYAIDARRSRLAVRTRAEGVLARLAHDVELVASEISGWVERDGRDWRGGLVVPRGSLRVAGTLRGERLDAGVLSAADRADIERRVRDEVLPADVVVERRDDLLVRLGGASARVELRPAFEEQDGTLWIAGRCTVSLAALGAGQVRGPLGAFRVRDAVEVVFRLALNPG